MNEPRLLIGDIGCVGPARSLSNLRRRRDAAPARRIPMATSRVIP
jgi:hypothetical protein